MKVRNLRDGGGKKRAIHDYSLLSPIRDFHGDCPDHCLLFFGFARDLIDRKHLYVLQQNVGLAIGVQQIRGIRSTEPMSAAGMTPPPRLNGLNVSWDSGCRTNRPSRRSGRR